MKSNVISGQFTTDYFDGTLQIIGLGRGSVVFRLSGDFIGFLLRDLPSFCKNSISTKDVESRKDTLIFEYNLREELRNPNRLLKSVRNRLAQTTFRNQNESDREFNETYSVPDSVEHRMFR